MALARLISPDVVAKDDDCRPDERQGQRAFFCGPVDTGEETHMRAARMHEYGKPPVLEDVPVPESRPDEILVNVKACGMCRSDVQLVDGYFRKYADIPTPITLGHEITGIVHKIGGVVPKEAGFQ